MKFQANAIVHIYFVGRPEKILVGRLILKERKIFFEYSSEFIKTGLEISPFKLPLRPEVLKSPDLTFDGLFGVFNDSLPDGWGRLLLDRKLRSLEVNPGSLSPLDRLCYVGKNGMGALVYAPEIRGVSPLKYENLDEIAEEVYAFQEHDDEQFLDELLAMNSSSAGARPKVLIHKNRQDWIIKFWSSTDLKDVGPMEYAYHLMAKQSGLELPEARLFPSKKRVGYFGSVRFDRQQNRHVHMHTLSGLIHADHRLPSLDYGTIMKATSLLTKSYEACERQFRAAVFNVLAHNRDDHAKNFSFLMDARGAWQVSPAYDLTFSSGPSGEHCTTIMGAGKNPKLAHLIKLASLGAISQEKALHIIEEVKQGVSQWKILSKEAGVSPASSKMIQAALNSVLKELYAS